MTNLEFQMEQKRLALELSKFEPPATIRQAEIDLEKAQRDLMQMKENYKIKLQQNATRVMQATRDVKQREGNISRLEDLKGRFIVKAPKKGLLVYIPDCMSGGK